jgi:hypothetical protein
MEGPNAMGQKPIFLIDLRRDPPVAIDAILHLHCAPGILQEAEASWGPIRRKAAEDALASQDPARINAFPQHFHWDWCKKQGFLSLLSYRSMAIECEGDWHGLSMLDLDSHRSWFDRKRPLVYVEFLETAPWNIVGFGLPRRFGGVGDQLMRAAVELSIAMGWDGRLGLHSLPQAEAFYRRCGMSDLGIDPAKENLRYFELTREQASAFLNSDRGR